MELQTHLECPAEFCIKNCVDYWIHKRVHVSNPCAIEEEIKANLKNYILKYSWFVYLAEFLLEEDTDSIDNINCEEGNPADKKDPDDNSKSLGRPLLLPLCFGDLPLETLFMSKSALDQFPSQAASSTTTWLCYLPRRGNGLFTVSSLVVWSFRSSQNYIHHWVGVC